MSDVEVKPVVVDARAAAYSGDPIRILGLVMPTSGRIVVKKQANWKEQPIPKDNVVVVTDTPMIFEHWDLSFDESEQMKEVMATYNEAQRSGLIKIEDALRRYEPMDVIQMRKIDERGKVLDFDSMGITNGHVAVLLAIWAARKIHGGYLITEEPESNDEQEGSGYGLMPFSI